MNQDVELKIGEATIVVSSETIKARIIRDSLYRKLTICVEGIEKALDIEDTSQNILVTMHNYVVFSARIKIKSGELPFGLLLPSDSDEIVVKKALQFIEQPYTEIMAELIGLVNRIDAPDVDALAPGATDKYEDFDTDDFDALPEDEKKS